jgi:hypothetical protein
MAWWLRRMRRHKLVCSTVCMYYIVDALVFEALDCEGSRGGKGDPKPRSVSLVEIGHRVR